MKPSGIGGMAVIEGVMMKNKKEYAVAVRKPNDEIEIKNSTYNDFSDKVKLFKLPIFRGILAFIDSTVIGIKVLTYAASFFDDEETESTDATSTSSDKKSGGKKGKKSDKYMAEELAVTDDRIRIKYNDKSGSLDDDDYNNNASDNLTNDKDGNNKQGNNKHNNNSNKNNSNKNNSNKNINGNRNNNGNKNNNINNHNGKGNSNNNINKNSSNKGSNNKNSNNKNSNNNNNNNNNNNKNNNNKSNSINSNNSKSSTNKNNNKNINSKNSSGKDRNSNKGNNAKNSTVKNNNIKNNNSRKDTDNDNKEDSNIFLMIAAVCISFIFAIGFFMVLPVIMSNFIGRFIESKFWLSFTEGALRLLLFIGYVLLVSLMPDIKRVFMYHGAEHKTINCIENGFELTLDNVKWQSKQHKRCGTSFMILVVLISFIVFLLMPSMNLLLRIVSRVLLVPLIAGISYEFIRFAGRTDNKFINILSKPGLWMQGLTTKEPDDSMIEVAIASVDAVFDWREFIQDSQDNSGKNTNKKSIDKRTIDKRTIDKRTIDKRNNEKNNIDNRNTDEIANNKQFIDRKNIAIEDIAVEDIAIKDAAIRDTALKEFDTNISDSIYPDTNIPDTNDLEQKDIVNNKKKAADASEALQMNIRKARQGLKSRVNPRTLVDVRMLHDDKDDEDDEILKALDRYLDFDDDDSAHEDR